MKQITCYLIALMILFSSCSGKRNSESDNVLQNSISVSGTKFIDSFGRQVIFSGINKVNKDPMQNYTDNDSAEVYKNMRSWGINCIRLGVIWDGVEPEPGKYDEKYLDKVEKQVNMAAQNGIYVMLDMHQDLYGVSFGNGNVALGDGAPRWATLTDDLPHVRGEIWSDSYLISPAVQKAFDNFWANASASDGIGIQDHYIMMWKHVAERFAHNKAVIGYDIMNEPFSGSSATGIMPLIASEYGKLYAEETGKILSENELISVFSDEKLRFEALSRLKDPKKYARVFDSAREISRQFEKGPLQQMYQKVADAIRIVDSTHVLFLEHSYLGNMGISSDIEPVRAKNGTSDPLVAYAGHGYDLLVDTKFYDDQSSSRVEHIFTRINETSQRLNAPVIVGEWGAMSGNSEATASSARFITGLFEKFGFSHTYWTYYNGIGNELYFSREMMRPYPEFTAGSLAGYGVDHEKGIFSCSWDESADAGASTIIYLPDAERVKDQNISLTPSGAKTEIRTIENSKSGLLIIPPTGKSIKRKVEFKVN